MMRAVELADGRPRLGELPTPSPGYRQLLVRVTSAGINGADLHQAAGGYPPPPGAPATPGLEAAGEVVEVGPGCLNHQPGDHVMAVVQGGGHAELCLIDEVLAMPVPAALPLKIAGALPEVFATAHDALFTQAGLMTGERVCIHGAAGGVGSAAVQLAVATGARVTTTVRSPDARPAIAELGATVVGPDDFVDAGPYDVILELVGAPNWPANIDAVAPQGRIVVIGVGAGADVHINLLQLMIKRARISASTLRARPLEQRAAVTRRLERHVLPLIESGAARVPVAATYPLSDAALAYERFAEGGKIGKIILQP